MTRLRIKPYELGRERIHQRVVYSFRVIPQKNLQRQTDNQIYTHTHTHTHEVCQNEQLETPNNEGGT